MSIDDGMDWREGVGGGMERRRKKDEEIEKG